MKRSTTQVVAAVAAVVAVGAVAAVDDEDGVQWRRGGGVQWRRQRLMEATQQPTTRCATGG